MFNIEKKTPYLDTFHAVDVGLGVQSTSHTLPLCPIFS